MVGDYWLATLQGFHFSTAHTPSDWNITETAVFIFSDFDNENTISENTIDINIIDDEIPEGLEILVCVLQTTDVLLQVLADSPDRVTIAITDDDG